MLLFLRIIVLISTFFTISIPLIPICLIFPRSPICLYYAAKVYSFIGFKILGIKIIGRNIHLVKNAKPSIIISNHQSYLDMLVGCFFIPKYTVSLGKKAILYIPFFGILYWLTGNIIINRLNKRQAHKSMENIGKEIKKRNIFVWIMGEGTRNKTDAIMLPLKKGPFHVATKAQIPISPIAISRFNHINLNHLKAGTIIIEALPMIPTVGKSKADIKDLSELAYNTMVQKITEITEEISSIAN